MAKIRSSLTSIMNTEEVSSTYYRIAHYLLTNNYLVTRISIQDVADNCYCSKSTISRFCRKLGYDDFYELNLDLYTSSQKSQDKFNKYINGTLNDICNLYFHDVLSCIQSANENIQQDDIQYMVHEIQRHTYVGIFGNLQSQAVAENFQMDLGLCRKIIVSSSLPQNQKTYIEQAGRDTLIIIISCSGDYFRNHIDLSKYNKDDRPKFILLTTNKAMLNNQLYDKILYFPSEKNYASQPRIINIFLNLVAIAYAKATFTIPA